MKSFSVNTIVRGTRKRLNGKYRRKGETCISVQYFLA